MIARTRILAILVIGAFPAIPLSMAAGGEIDRLVDARQEATGFPPSAVCSDEIFIRRVHLDVTGTLPSGNEVRSFLDQAAVDKRARLIDRLLDRPEFAEYLALKWCDLLRVKSEFPGNLWPNAVQAYHRWIRDAIRNGMPYDRFARALLTASGSNFRDPPANYHRPFQTRSPRDFLETTALVFMGVRIENSGWSEEERLGMEAFFAKTAFKPTREWKEEIVYCDPHLQLLHPQTGRPVQPTPIGGAPMELPEFDDPRTAFADWLTAPENPWFARHIVNRIWFWLMGRGLVHEPDDLRPDNPAWSPELLDFLARELRKADYDLRHVYRLILNSDTYQRSSVPTADNAGDTAGFSHYRIRRLDAEVIMDALVRITGAGEEYVSAIPEPFTFIPPSRKTITLADGSIKSPFLEMFGRPGRDTSLETDRNNEVTVFQALHLLNATHIQNKISKGGVLRKVRAQTPEGTGPVAALYLEILSRDPTPDERKAAAEYLRESGLNQDEALRDLAWALINSSEFILKH